MEENYSQIDEQELRSELRRFNWGSAIMGFIWAIACGCFKKWTAHASIIVIVLWFLILFVYSQFMPYSEYDRSLLPIIWLGCLLFWECIIILPIIFIYTGIKGNRWAWASGKYKSLAEFIREQRIWGGVSLVVLFGQVVLPLFVIISQGYFGYTMAQLKQDRISKNECNTMYKALPEVFAKMKDGFDENIYTVQLARNPNITKVYPITLYANTYNSSLDIYNAADNAHPMGKSRVDLKIINADGCSFKQANCYVEIVSHKSSEEFSCKFYFNQNGKMLPSKHTMRYLGISNNKKQE